MRADKILVELGTANIQILEYMHLLSFELHIKDREDSKIIKASLEAIEKSRRPLASVVECSRDSVDDLRNVEDQSRAAALGRSDALGRSESLISQVSTKLNVSDSLGDASSIGEQSIKSASGHRGFLRAPKDTKMPKRSSGKRIGSGSGIDGVKGLKITAGSPVMASNQREQDFGGFGQNINEAKSTDGSNKISFLPTASKDRTYTGSEPIARFIETAPSFLVTAKESFSYNPGGLIMCHIDPQTHIGTICDLIRESSIPDDGPSGLSKVMRKNGSYNGTKKESTCRLHDKDQRRSVGIIDSILTEDLNTNK
jgi:hypothetical protein